MTGRWYESPTLDLTQKYGGTKFSNTEVFMIGESLLAWIGAGIQLGHSSPGSTLDYAKGDAVQKSVGALIIRDVIAWTSGRIEMAPGCEERIRDLMDEGAYGRHLAEVLDQDGRWSA